MILVREADAAAGWGFSAVRLGNRLKAVVGRLAAGVSFPDCGRVERRFCERHGFDVEARAPRARGRRSGTCCSCSLAIARVCVNPPTLTICRTAGRRIEFAAEPQRAGQPRRPIRTARSARAARRAGLGRIQQKRMSDQNTQRAALGVRVVTGKPIRCTRRKLRTSENDRDVRDRPSLAAERPGQRARPPAATHRAPHSQTRRRPIENVPVSRMPTSPRRSAPRFTVTRPPRRDSRRTPIAARDALATSNDPNRGERGSGSSSRVASPGSRASPAARA